MAASEARQPATRPNLPERAALVGVAASRQRGVAEASLDELAALAEAAGAEVVLRLLQERERPDPAFFVGRGKVAALAAAVSALALDVVIVDNELTPAQTRNLERALETRVIDRTQLILDIFARRARTREGQLQVELAQLKYLLPRLVGRGAELSRLGGGIGTRGPGETKLETDRRRVRQRIGALVRQLEGVRRRRARLRARRDKRAVPTVALVGYTNAGKTTLFNALTGAAALAAPAPFATLDPLVRQVKAPGGAVFLLSDTVGFIRRLPHTLVAAFRATLEEVREAELLVHVVDAAAPTREAQMQAVGQVLEQVGALEVPRLDVFNKVDLIDQATRRDLARRYPDALLVSARTGEGLEALCAAVAARLQLTRRRVRLEFDAASESGQRQLARVYRWGRVVERIDRDGRIRIEAELPARMLAELAAARV
jgi:GTP-binding protein HflX